MSVNFSLMIHGLLTGKEDHFFQGIWLTLHSVLFGIFSLRIRKYIFYGIRFVMFHKSYIKMGWDYYFK